MAVSCISTSYLYYQLFSSVNQGQLIKNWIPVQVNMHRIASHPSSRLWCAILRNASANYEWHVCIFIWRAVQLQLHRERSMDRWKINFSIHRRSHMFCLSSDWRRKRRNARLGEEVYMDLLHRGCWRWWCLVVFLLCRHSESDNARCMRAVVRTCCANLM